jgi:hypothetical protein
MKAKGEIWAQKIPLTLRLAPVTLLSGASLSETLFIVKDFFMICHTA